eukprot:1365526-Rhodomonas_salina.2
MFGKDNVCPADDNVGRGVLQGGGGATGELGVAQVRRYNSALVLLSCAARSIAFLVQTVQETRRNLFDFAV